MPRLLKLLLKAVKKPAGDGGNGPSGNGKLITEVVKAVPVFKETHDNAAQFINQLKEKAAIHGLDVNYVMRVALSDGKFGPVASSHIRQVCGCGEKGMRDITEVTAVEIEVAFTTGGFGKYGTPGKILQALLNEWPGIMLRDRKLTVSTALDAFELRLSELPESVRAQLPPTSAPTAEGSVDRFAFSGLVLIALFCQGFPEELEHELRCDGNGVEYASWHAFRVHALSVASGLDNRLVQLRDRTGGAQLAKTSNAPSAAKRPFAASPPGPGKRSKPDGRKEKPAGASLGIPKGAEVVPATAPTVPTNTSHAKQDGWIWRLEGLNATERKKRSLGHRCVLCGGSGHMMPECPQRESLFRSGKLKFFRQPEKN